MSFLTLSQPKEAANFFNSAFFNSARHRPVSGIDPHRGKASGESPATLFRGDPDGALLFACLVTDWKHGRARCSLGRCVLDLSTKTLKEIADQPSQTEILGRQIFHLHDRRNVETTKTSSPSIESSQRYSGSTANFGNGYAGARLIEQMKNFIFSESGPSHRIALVQLPSWDDFNRRRRRFVSSSRFHGSNLTQSLAAQNTCAKRAAKRVAMMSACLQHDCLICSLGLPGETNGAPPRNSRHARKYGMGIPRQLESTGTVRELGRHRYPAQFSSRRKRNLAGRFEAGAGRLI
jgi:hypothetical protein